MFYISVKYCTMITWLKWSVIMDYGFYTGKLGYQLYKEYMNTIHVVY